jgi:chromosome segregation ATPase
MELPTNGVVITDAIKHVQGQMNHLNRQKENIERYQRRDGRTSSGRYRAT